MTWAPPAVYAILDTDTLDLRGLDALAVADAWLRAGIRLLQLRAKPLSFGPLLARADALVRAARRSGASVIINDRADVARLAGAAGLHLGQDDLSVPAARRLLGEGAIIGLSAHTTAEVERACREPVSYVAIGPVYATESKARAHPVVGLEGVVAAAGTARRAGLPLVAIGGITLERAPRVLEAGAVSVAVIADLMSGDPGDRARQWVAALG